MVDYEAGRLGPLPDWVRVMLAAHWMGVAPWALIEQDEFWIEAGLLMRGIEAKASHKGSKKK